MLGCNAELNSMAKPRFTIICNIKAIFFKFILLSSNLNIQLYINILPKNIKNIAIKCINPYFQEISWVWILINVKNHLKFKPINFSIK